MYHQLLYLEFPRFWEILPKSLTIPSFVQCKYIQQKSWSTNVSFSAIIVSFLSPFVRNFHMQAPARKIAWLRCSRKSCFNSTRRQASPYFQSQKARDGKSEAWSTCLLSVRNKSAVIFSEWHSLTMVSRSIRRKKKLATSRELRRWLKRRARKQTHDCRRKQMDATQPV